MRRLLIAAWMVALALPAGSAEAAAQPASIGHVLQVRIDPDTHRIAVRDRVSIPAARVTAPLDFTLAAELTLTSRTPQHPIRLLGRRDDAAPSDDDAGQAVKVYRVDDVVPGQDLILDLRYEGVIDHPIRQTAALAPQGISETPGLIDARGVYLAGSSHWVPAIGSASVTFRLETDLPAGWSSVSEGERDGPAGSADPDGRVHAVWQASTPSEQIHLIAARFTEYTLDHGRIRAYAFLRSADPALADRYLHATARYLAMYEAALGPYPYRKFALVENFWQTGFGMASFTLLGDTILRFPFLLTSSYPHELLHNWWGNGVFVDGAQGNWCEGLTTYLADHLIAEQEGRGDVYRRDALARASDFVAEGKDFPLRAFVARRDGLSEAIGYGKAMMVWNMLRVRLGDDAFLAGLQRFYRDHLFQAAGYDDLQHAFEAGTGKDLGGFFRQWIDGVGLPDLALRAAQRAGRQVTLTVAQTQAGPPLALEVPVAFRTAHGVVWRTLDFTTGTPSLTRTFDLPEPALRVDLDPQFQVYRRLHPDEVPPALSKAFGAERALIVVPGGAPDDRYAGLLKAWTREGVEIVDDLRLVALPTDRPVWVLGRANRFVATVVRALGQQGIVFDPAAPRLGGTRYSADDRSVVLVARPPGHPDSVLVYLDAASAAAAEGLARKLPHYGKFSWLVFRGSAPDHEAKGEWPIAAAPLGQVFEQTGPIEPLPARKALAELPAELP